jgi:hypothetical protein
LNDPHRELVERGYDRVAEGYLATKIPQDPLALFALEDLSRDLRPGAPSSTSAAARASRRPKGWGARYGWSHYDAQTNKGMLREAGFDFVYAEPRTGGAMGDDEETWLWVLARKGPG